MPLSIVLWECQRDYLQFAAEYVEEITIALLDHNHPLCQCQTGWSMGDHQQGCALQSSA
jgi:hypothetical protein